MSGWCSKRWDSTDLGTLRIRILTLNCNGLRSAARKGLLDWLPGVDPDVVCLQETRVHAAERERLGGFGLAGFEARFHDAAAPGYSGVAIYSRRAPDAVIEGIGHDAFDREGRWLEFRFGRVSIVSLYLPSGSSSEDRQAFKFTTLDWLEAKLAALHAEGRDSIICGDWNIAHRPIDLKNWRGNQKNSGFLPEERCWMDRLLAGPWLDSFRVLEPERAVYTWWSNRGQAYAKDVGWRIDYQIVSASLRDRLRAVRVYREPRFSDHAPYVVDYDLPAA